MIMPAFLEAIGQIFNELQCKYEQRNVISFKAVLAGYHILLIGGILEVGFAKLMTKVTNTTNWKYFVLIKAVYI